MDHTEQKGKIVLASWFWATTFKKKKKVLKYHFSFFFFFLDGEDICHKEGAVFAES